MFGHPPPHFRQAPPAVNSAPHFRIHTPNPGPPDWCPTADGALSLESHHSVPSHAVTWAASPPGSHCAAQPAPPPPTPTRLPRARTTLIMSLVIALLYVLVLRCPARLPTDPPRPTGTPSCTFCPSRLPISPGCPLPRTPVQGPRHVEPRGHLTAWFKGAAPSPTLPPACFVPHTALGAHSP